MSYHSKIDVAIKKASTLNNQTSELGQMSKLFSDHVLNTILKENHNARGNSSQLINSVISVTWIDKIPLAKFIGTVADHHGNFITQKVELGDALLIDIHNDTSSNSIQSSAFFLQAKRAKSSKIPKVPVYMGKTQNNSSLKELALLRNWPKFDLYKTSGDKLSVLSSIQLPMPVPPLAYGGFAVCPTTINSNAWKAHWMCARPEYNAPFNITFGELLSYFFKINTKIHIGESFTLGKSNDPWSKLINNIIDIAKEYSTPSSYSNIYGENRNKVISFIKDVDLEYPHELFHYLHENFNSYQPNISNSDSAKLVPPKKSIPIIIYGSTGRNPITSKNHNNIRW
ncbi:hypothetical protein ACU7RR_002299 [Providencia stuartii]|uniref:Uncharacterized protein n=1 Tax=Providencia stuartii (strain MRSN 2154) TaxID=1157951 RepID=A0A140NI24_PROSM|nr:MULTISPECIES: hypothetical protein [Providencia]AFH92551.1 hypothetical protein S70_03310 [Providencia stuartii MRSN 2154]MDE8747099.1 hypothetical protein [Providencia thailandensis]MDE8765682.1 hypothetical protein [Providencia thailandensis]MDE8777918.1 hypothetical protein [Providencia thailandensis]MDE8782346.1 hypothetical protein [Providencia thailandensis]